VHNLGTCLEIFGLGDPHGLEGRQGSKDGSSNPHQELPLGRSKDLDLHGAWCLFGDLLGETLWESAVHGGSTAQYDVLVEGLADINVALHNGVVGDFVETWQFLSHKHGLEENFWAAESLTADFDNSLIGHSVRLDVTRASLIG